MDNSFFLFSEDTAQIKVERFHICTWEFGDSSALVEFGVEVSKESITDDSMEIELYVPWIVKDSKVKDLYESLNDSDNSRFIFNDSIEKATYVSKDHKNRGVIHTFSGRGDLTILPVKPVVNGNNKVISIKLDFQELKTNSHWISNPSNVYFRFYVETSVDSISTRDKGIGKSTIIYDLKLNEKRNLPLALGNRMTKIRFCKVNICFCLHILPNRYQIQFIESNALKKIRTLEYNAFSKYLQDSRVKNNTMVYSFNKLSEKEPLYFLSVFSDERIGTPHFTVGILASILSGILLYIPQFRKDIPEGISIIDTLKLIECEIWIALLLAIAIGIYFSWSYLYSTAHWLKSKSR